MKLEDIDKRIYREPETGCWIWEGPQDGKGYGQVNHEGRTVRTHRLVFTLIRGEIAEGLQLDHLCRNRACCNPWHLDPVTGQENIRRSPIHNGSKTHCKHGHEFTPENTGHTHHAGYTRRFCRTCNRAVNNRCGARRRARLKQASLEAGGQ